MADRPYEPSPVMDVYTRPARFVHWATAVLLAALFGLGISMTRWIEGDAKLTTYAWHETIGLTVFALTAFRLVWRLTHPPPPFPLPWIERVGAQMVHVLMYVVLVSQPIVGWMLTGAFGFEVLYLGLVPLPNLVGDNRELATTLQTVHARLAIGLAVLFVLHLGGVLYHHLGKRDGLLRRMLASAFDPSAAPR